MRKLMLGVAAMVAVGQIATSATAQTVEYNAQLDRFCCYMTLEPGDSAVQFMSFKNVGTKTWFPVGEVPVRLGTSNPFDRSSPFFHPRDWAGPQRPTALDQAAVPPGQIGSFTWVTKAPQPGSYREYYAPVAELRSWMAPTDLYHLDYTVIPAQDPVLRITGATARVKRGDPIGVTADATDNRGVSMVTFTVGTETATALIPRRGASGYGALLSSAKLGAGTHNVVVRAYDLGGRESSAVAALEVYGPPVAPASVARLPAFEALFATRAGRGGHLGTFNGLGDVVAARRGAILRVVCVAGCSRRLRVWRRVPARGSLRIGLARPLVLRRSTRIELQLSAPGFVTRYQRYRFRRRPEGTRAVQVAAGCLARKTPRRTTRCPRA